MIRARSPELDRAVLACESERPVRRKGQRRDLLRVAGKSFRFAMEKPPEVVPLEACEPAFEGFQIVARVYAFRRVCLQEFSPTLDVIFLIRLLRQCQVCGREKLSILYRLQARGLSLRDGVGESGERDQELDGEDQRQRRHDSELLLTLSLGL